MRSVLAMFVTSAVLLVAVGGCSSRPPAAAPDQSTGTGDGKHDAGPSGTSLAQGFDTPEAALEAYGKALADGDSDAYRKIAAKDTGAIAGLDAIIQLETGKSVAEAAKINLQALAPNQGFGNVASKRFPAEITGDNAVIVQLFERAIALKTEVHFRKFMFSKAGDSWFLVGSKFGEAAELSDKYAWDKESEGKAVDSSGRTAMSYIPQDAIAAVVVHPRRAAASEIGQALLGLDVVQTKLQQSQLRPDGIEQIIYTMGFPTEESENDCTIVQFLRPMPRATLLQEEFGGLPYEEIQFQGATYFRYADQMSAEAKPAESPDAQPTTQPDRTAATPITTASVMAKYPDDLQPSANGHADSSDSGNWNYYSSDKQNPALEDARLAKLTWNPKESRYEGNELHVNRKWPAVGGSLHPGFKGPRFAVLRWESRTSAPLAVRGSFKAIPGAKEGDGVRVLVFVDGRPEFSADVKRGDSTGVEFDVSALVKPGSTIDFVVDPKRDSSYDSTLLNATIERSGGNAAAKPDLVDIPDEPATGDEEAATLPGTAIYFPDDKTLVSTDEHRLRSLIAGSPSQTLLTKKLSQLDLNHDLVAVVAIEGGRDQLSELLNMVAEQTRSVELAGLSVLPQHAEFAVATLDLAGETLLNVAVDAPSEQSAGEVAGGFDSLLDALEGLQHVVPKESSLLPLVEQLVQGTELKTTGLQVGLTIKMPDGLADFVKKDAASALNALTEMSVGPDEDLPRNVPDVSHDKDASGERTNVFYREPPKDHPEFRDLAVESHDCRVFFPGKPDFTEDVVPIEDGNVHVANFLGETPRARYMLEIYTYPKAAVARIGIKTLLDQTRDALVDAPTGRVVSSKSFTFQDAPALDFVYEHPDVTGPGQAHCRVVIRGNRLYLLEAEGTRVPPAEIAVFHDSLAPYALPGASTTESDLPPISVTPKLPLPDQAARDKALELVRELYRQDFQSAKTPAEKNSLAEKIIARASDVEAPAERFVSFDVARKIAAGAGGVDAVIAALARLDNEFEIDSVQLSSESLVDLAKATLTTQDRSRVASEMLNAAQSAVDEDRYDFAVGLLQHAVANARNARELNLVKRATERLSDTQELQTRYKAVEPELEMLTTDPDDPAANQTVGEFYCFAKGQWDRGLSYLAKGNDTKIRSLAALELTQPTSAEQQIQIADQWSELANTADGLSEKRLQLHAAVWYRQALPHLTGLQKEAVEKRLSEMKYAAEAAGPRIVFLVDVPLLGAEGVLINDDKGHFREERLKGEKYTQVLWAHPKDDMPSHYAFTLNRKYSQLTGKAAINDVQSVARAQKPQMFAIYGDNRPLWKSRPLQDKLDSQEFAVNVSNVKTLHFYVSGGGYGGHALWVDVVLEEKQ